MKKPATLRALIGDFNESSDSLKKEMYQRAVKEIAKKIAPRVVRRAVKEKGQLTEDKEAEQYGWKDLGGGTFEDEDGTRWKRDEQDVWQDVTDEEADNDNTSGDNNSSDSEEGEESSDGDGAPDTSAGGDAPPPLPGEAPAGDTPPPKSPSVPQDPDERKKRKQHAQQILPATTITNPPISDIPSNLRDKVVSKIDALADVALKASAQGNNAKPFDLCSISIPDTNLFCQENRGVPVHKMPKFTGVPESGKEAAKLPRNAKGEVDGEKAFRKKLADDGIAVGAVTSIPPEYLRATQTSIDGTQVGAMIRALESGRESNDESFVAITRPMFVTRDGYIIDGHHRWAAIAAYNLANPDDQIEMQIEVIDSDIMPMIDFAKRFADEFGIKPANDSAPNAQKQKTESIDYFIREVANQRIRLHMENAHMSPRINQNEVTRKVTRAVVKEILRKRLQESKEATASLRNLTLENVTPQPDWIHISFTTYQDSQGRRYSRGKDGQYKETSDSIKGKRWPAPDSAKDKETEPSAGRKKDDASDASDTASPAAPRKKGGRVRKAMSAARKTAARLFPNRRPPLDKKLSEVPRSVLDQVSTDIDALLRVLVNPDNPEQELERSEHPFFNLCIVSIPGTNLFCDGHQDIPRDEMPQFKGKAVPGSRAEEEGRRVVAAGGKLGGRDQDVVDGEAMFMQHLKDLGIGLSEPATVNPEFLKATQSELDGTQTASMTRALEAGRDAPKGSKERAIFDAITAPIFVTNDAYVVDGHHRWASIVAYNARNPDRAIKLKVQRIDSEILPLIDIANEWAADFGIAPNSARDGAQTGDEKPKPTRPEIDSVEDLRTKAGIKEPEGTSSEKSSDGDTETDAPSQSRQTAMDALPKAELPDRDLSDIPDGVRSQVSTDIAKLAEMGNEARAAEKKAPFYNLCRVSIPGTNLFCEGNKNIRRHLMPQFKGKPVAGSRADSLPKNKDGEVDGEAFFQEMLSSKDIKVSAPLEVNPEYLRATQSELDGAKVGGMMSAMERGRDAEEGSKERTSFNNITAPIYVARDGYVVDGHHRWAAIVSYNARNPDRPLPMRVQVIDRDIDETIQTSNDFAKEFGIAAKSADDGRPEIDSLEEQFVRLLAVHISKYVLKEHIGRKRVLQLAENKQAVHKMAIEISKQLLKENIRKQNK